MSALSALAEQGIHADRDGLHLVPPEDMERSAALQRDSQEFLNKTKQFDELVSDFIQVMESRSKVIEAEKLKAIGLGNRIDSEQEVRRARARGVCAVCVCVRGERARTSGPCSAPLARGPRDGTVSLRGSRQVRKRKQVELQAIISEKKAELDRLSTQYDSLVRVDAEQKALIEKLTNNEA